MQPNTQTKLPIPKIQDLVVDASVAFKNDEFKTLLNQNPPKQWVLTNKYANNSLYIPIDKVEYLLDKIFGEWKAEVKEVITIFNSVSVTIRLHYKSPINGEWYFHDGVGAKEMQTNSQSGTLKPDFSNIKSGAVEMAVPIAKSYAIKDAADHLGKLFGRDLNRTTAVSYERNYQEKPPSITTAEYQDKEQKDRVVKAISNAGSIVDLKRIPANLISLYDLEDVYESKEKQFL